MAHLMESYTLTFGLCSVKLEDTGDVHLSVFLKQAKQRVAVDFHAARQKKEFVRL